MEILINCDEDTKHLIKDQLDITSKKRKMSIIKIGRPTVDEEYVHNG